MKDLKQTIITKLKDNAKLTLKDDGVDMKRVFETDADSMVEICNTHADELAIGFVEWLRTETNYCGGGKYFHFETRDSLEIPKLLTIYKQTLC